MLLCCCISYVSSGGSQAEFDLHVYDDPASCQGPGDNGGSTVVSPTCLNNDKCDIEDALYSKLADCLTSEVISNTADPYCSCVQDVYSNVDRKTPDEEAEYYNAETITR